MTKDGYIDLSVFATNATWEGVADFLFSEEALGLVIEDSPEDPPGHLIRASFSKTLPIGPIVERLMAYQSDLVDLGFAGAEGRIEVREEPETFGAEQPECLLLLSWHLSEELVGKLRAKGFRGKIVKPLPEVEVIDG